MRLTPPVFAETLARMLQRPDLELVVGPAALGDEGPYDGALVSRTGFEDARDVAVVVALPESQDAGVGVVITPDGEREIALHTLEEVRGLVDDLWPRGGGA